MSSNFFLVAGQVVTLFLLIGVGFTLGRLGKLTAVGISQMTTLALYIVIPCVIIGAFQVDRSPELIRSLLLAALAIALYYVFNLFFIHFLFPGQPESARTPLRFGCMYGNCGFMGLPLVLAVLGPDAVIYGVLAVVLFNLFQWTHGIRAMGGRLSLRQALVNPGTIGLAFGLVLFLTGLRLPGPLNSAVGFLADLNTPLAMVIIGGQMSAGSLKALFHQPRLYAASAYKLLFAPLVLLFGLLPLHPDPILYCACVILHAAPTAGTTSMLAQNLGQDGTVAAQLVSLSTLLSVLTLPVFAVAAKALGGL